ncbi:MFS transporter [soil metagenome]|jgi:MFS family permease|nr:MFS transporter [Deinococcota bacterium]
MIGRFPHSFDALSHPAFRNFWFAQGFSLIGSWMGVTAQAWLVFDLVPDPAEAALKFGYVGALQFAPTLLLSLFAGVVIDATSRRSVLLVCQGVLALSAAALALLTFTGWLSYPLLLVIAAVGGVTNAFDVPARQSLVPDLVPKRDLRNAVSLNSLAFNVARLIGPAVAAAAIAASGHLFGDAQPLLRYSPAITLNALSFAVVIAAIWNLRVPRQAARPHRVFAEIREGLAYVWGQAEVRLATMLAGALSLTIVNFQMIVPLFARQALGLEIGGLGLLLSSLGLGAILAFGVNTAYGDGDRLMLMRRGALLLSLAFLAFVMSPNLPVAALALVACGLGMILTTVNAQATVQLLVPDALRGRVMSIYMLVFAGFVPFGALLVSQLVGRLGPRWGLLAVGLLGLAAVLIFRPHKKFMTRLRAAQATD